jgi:hypothetical protein
VIVAPTNFLDQHATEIQAISSLATLLLTAVLVFVTWRYVQLTRDLVEHNRELTELETARETVRRRRKAISLRRAALVLEKHLEESRELLPGDLRGASWDWRTEIDEVKRLALDVGWGLDRLALAAGDDLERWYSSGSEELAEGRAAIAAAISHLQDLVAEAMRITEDES